MMLWLSLAMHTGLAQEVKPVDPGDFEATVGSSTLTVTQVGIPRAVEVKNPERTCRVQVMAHGTTVESQLDPSCHPGLAWAVEEAMANWAMALDAPVGRPRELLELWFVFPRSKRESVEVLVRQAYDVSLTLEPLWLDVVRYEMVAMSLPSYPAEALGKDTTITQCDVEIEVGRSMAPSKVEVSRCDEVFHAEARRAVGKWLVQGPERQNQVLWTGLKVGLRFVRDLDGEGGNVEVQLPENVELGGRSAEWTKLPFAMPEKREMPEGEPVLEVAYRGYRSIGVYDLVWPDPVAYGRELRCDVLMIVNDERQVFAWAQGYCDDEVRRATTQASRAWHLQVGETKVDAAAARLRGTFVYPADGSHPRFRIDAEHLVTPPRELPKHVEFVRPPTATRRLPPKIRWWRDVDFGDETVECRLEVDVGTSGRPVDVWPASCPPVLFDVARKTVRKWRWAPASANGKAVRSRVSVTMRFDPRAQSR